MLEKLISIYQGLKVKSPIQYRPHMGTSQCFLGKPWGEHLEETNQTTGQWTAFFYSPEFIYFYSVVLALQAANVIFFLLTVYYLVQHWRNSAGIIKTETKGNFIIVLKLFFIMGIPWLGEFISHLTTHKNGPESSVVYRLVFDFLNLFTVSGHWLWSWVDILPRNPYLFPRAISFP